MRQKSMIFEYGVFSLIFLRWWNYFFPFLDIVVGFRPFTAGIRQRIRIRIQKSPNLATRKENIAGTKRTESERGRTKSLLLELVSRPKRF